MIKLFLLFSILFPLCPCDTDDADVNELLQQADYCSCDELPGGCDSIEFDLYDVGWFYACFTGPEYSNEQLHPFCLCRFDIKIDSIVDLQDFAKIQNQIK